MTFNLIQKCTKSKCKFALFMQNESNVMHNKLYESWEELYLWKSVIAQLKGHNKMNQHPLVSIFIMPDDWSTTWIHFLLDPRCFLYYLLNKFARSIVYTLCVCVRAHFFFFTWFFCFPSISVAIKNKMDGIFLCVCVLLLISLSNDKKILNDDEMINASEKKTTVLK